MTDLGVLRKLDRLAELRIESTVLVDLGAVAGMPRLVTLLLGSCGPTVDLEPLAACRNLTSLIVEADGADLTPLGACIGLTVLDFSMSIDLHSVAAIKPLVALRDLDISNSQVATLEPLRGMRQLERLVCDGFVGVTLAPLADLRALQYLSLAGSDGLSDLAPLAALTRLERLDLRLCGAIHNLAPLAGLARLAALDLAHCKSVASIGALEPLTALTALKLEGCDLLTDLRPLARLTNLCTLSLPERSLGDIDWRILEPLVRLGTPENVAEGSAAASTVLEPPAPTHHSHARPLALFESRFGYYCAWCRRSEEAETGYRCEECGDYNLCVECHERVRVKPRAPSFASSSSSTSSTLSTGCGGDASVGDRQAAAVASTEMLVAMKNRVLSDIRSRAPTLGGISSPRTWSPPVPSLDSAHRSAAF